MLGRRPTARWLQIRAYFVLAACRYIVYPHMYIRRSDVVRKFERQSFYVRSSFCCSSAGFLWPPEAKPESLRFMTVSTRHELPIHHAISIWVAPQMISPLPKHWRTRMFTGVWHCMTQSPQTAPSTVNNVINEMTGDDRSATIYHKLYVRLIIVCYFVAWRKIDLRWNLTVRTPATPEPGPLLLLPV